MLVMASATAEKAGGACHLAALTDRVASVLKMTKVYDSLSVHPDVDAAVRRLPGQG